MTLLIKTLLRLRKHQPLAFGDYAQATYGLAMEVSHEPR